MLLAWDGNDNRVVVSSTGRTYRGEPIVVVRLAESPDVGYLAADEGRGGFGTEECPSSYGMPCLTWFGPGERYDSAEEAIAAVAD